MVYFTRILYKVLCSNLIKMLIYKIKIMHVIKNTSLLNKIK